MAGESRLEEQARSYAAGHKIPAKSFRFKFLGYRGGKDCVFFPQDTEVLWVEFKNPNRKGIVSAMQIHVHKTITDLGHTVHVIDNFDDFREVYDAHVQ